MLYEIINPSDPYTFESESFAVAVVAMVLVGEGKIGAKPIGPDVPKDAPRMGPLFLMNAKALDEWFMENCGFPVDGISDFMNEHWSEIADALDSVVIGKEEDRGLFLSTLEKIEGNEKREAFRVEWQNKKCSSLNDIGTYCRDAAKAIRAKRK